MRFLNKSKKKLLYILKTRVKRLENLYILFSISYFTKNIIFISGHSKIYI